MPRKLTQEEFLLKSKEAHGERYDYSEAVYNGGKKKVVIICKIHGRFKQSAGDHFSGKGCSYCGGTRKVTYEDFLIKSKLIHKDRYSYEESIYVNYTTPLKIICKEHGIFLQTPFNHMMGRGCSDCGGSKRLTTEEFIKRGEAIHGRKYDYSKTDYINMNTFVTIICPIHGEFLQKPYLHIGKDRCGCSECGIAKFVIGTEKFIELAKLKFGETYDYSLVNYIRTDKKVIIICRKHGKFLQAPGPHLKFKNPCYKCHMESLRKSTEEFILEANKIHNYRFDYSNTKYFLFEEELEIICKSHGSFFQTAGSHLKRKNPCPKCLTEQKTKTTDDFILRSNKIHNNLYDYSKSEYVAAITKLIIICKIHGEFKQTPASHLFGRGCPSCGKSNSKPEIRYREFLGMEKPSSYLIVNGRKFSPDAINKEDRIVYELNGDFWHGNPKIFKENDVNNTNKKTYGFLHNKTLEKEKFLTENGYKVISIWECDFKLIEKYINSIHDMNLKNAIIHEFKISNGDKIIEKFNIHS